MNFSDPKERLAVETEDHPRDRMCARTWPFTEEIRRGPRKTGFPFGGECAFDLEESAIGEGVREIQDQEIVHQ